MTLDELTCSQCGSPASTRVAGFDVTNVSARGADVTVCFDTDLGAVYLHEPEILRGD